MNIVAIRVGIIGLGKMGILHAGIVNSFKNAEVAAICEKERFLIRGAKAILSNVEFYTDHTRMIQKEGLDAVFVTTPIHTHAPLVISLTKSDPSLSIFVEKPLATSGFAADTACKAVRKMSGHHMVGFQKRFSPTFLKAKEALENEILGELMFFKAYSYSSDVLRQGSSWRFKPGSGGVLLDLAPHILDLTIWFFGNPTHVNSVQSKIHSSHVEDYVHAVFSYKSGVRGHVDVCWSMSKYRLPETCIEIFGKHGNMVASEDYLKITKYGAFGKEETEQIFYKPHFKTSVPYLLAEPEFTREDEAFLFHKRASPDFFEASKVNGLIDKILH